MATMNENVKKIRDLAAKAGISETELVQACRKISEEPGEITGQSMLEGVKSAVEAAEHPHDRLKRNLFGTTK